MIVYRICPDGATSRAFYFATLAEAKASCRLRFPSTATRQGVEVQLVDVPTDKVSLLFTLNGDIPRMKLLRVWRLSDRGSFIETNTQGEDL